MNRNGEKYGSCLFLAGGQLVARRLSRIYTTAVGYILDSRRATILCRTPFFIFQRGKLNYNWIIFEFITFPKKEKKEDDTAIYFL
jgi:hypothetical protein